MHNVTECQQRLISLGYLPPLNAAGKTNADGTFGLLSLDAYNRYRASIGAGKVSNVTMYDLNSVLFPEERPEATPPKPVASNPVTDFLTGLAIKAMLSKLKGLGAMNFLSGYKTYIIGGILIIVGAAEFFGLQIPGVAGSPITLIMTGLGMITGRTATAKVAVAAGQ